MRALAWMLSLGLVSLAPAAESVARRTDPIVDGLVEWTRRGVEELRLENSPPPHRVVTAVADIRGFMAKANLGEIVFEIPMRDRQGRVEVVVGSDKLDSSRFTDSRRRQWSRMTSPRQQVSLPVEDGDLALARNLWAGVDASYKNALQRYQAKRAAREARGGEAAPPDWSPAEPTVDLDLAPLPRIDEEALRGIARYASKALREIGGLDEGEVSVSGVAYRYYMITSEGTRIAQPEAYAAVHATASLLREDGLRIRDEIQWVVREVADLPSLGVMVDEVRAMGASVRARAAGASIDYYEGPVIFEDRAAAEFFRYLLPPQIEGTPPEPEANVSYQQQARRGPRLGRRVLPEGWSVTDDPSKAPEGMAGGYLYDREGVRGQRVELVRDGYVRDLLMSRVPRTEKQLSNGHARGSMQNDWMARPSVLEVKSERNLSERAFAKAAEEVRERARQDRILVVRRVERGRSGRLPNPTDAVWRYADGREEPVPRLEFEHVDRRTMRSIAAAGGGEIVLPFLAGFESDHHPAADRGIPVVLTAPRRLLVEDMELVYPGPSEKPYSYPRPPVK